MANPGIRFCIDETRFRCAAESLPQTVESFIVLVDECRHPAEEIARASSLYCLEVCEGLKLVDLLYSPDVAHLLDDELRRTLRVMVDRCVELENTYRPPDTRTEVGGCSSDSISTSYAHDRALESHAVALLCMTPAAPPEGAHSVKVRRHEREAALFYVSKRSGLLAFLRAIPDVEDLDPGIFMQHAVRAFPDLFFVGGLADQASRFSKPFRQIRPVLTRHLSALNDDFLASFKLMKAEPTAVSRHFAATSGVDATVESAKTHKNKKAMKRRNVTIDGVALCCEWHTKLEPVRDRVHFHPGTPHVGGGRVVIGIFCEHLPT
jgi:hypothetical protein